MADITLSDICKATKLTTGALYFHFKSKDEAVEEMIIDEVSPTAIRWSSMAFAAAGSRRSSLPPSSSTPSSTSGQLPRAIQAIINARPTAYKAWLDFADRSS